MGFHFFCGETETRTRGTLTRSQISNLLHYHSATSPIKDRKLNNYKFEIKI